MKNKDKITIGLIGNPNAGKSSIFNHLTGLKQKIANYPGITVEKKTGRFKIDGQEFNLIDYPGAYSLYPNSDDERVVLNILADPSSEDYPDLLIYVSDFNNLEHHFLLYHQICNLNIPTVFVLTKLDMVSFGEDEFNAIAFDKLIAKDTVRINGRSGEGIIDLKEKIQAQLNFSPENSEHKFSEVASSLGQKISEEFSLNSNYLGLLWAHHYERFSFIEGDKKQKIASLIDDFPAFESVTFQIQETLSRFEAFTPSIKKYIKVTKKRVGDLNERIDDIVLHPFWGLLIFGVVIFTVFQALFYLAAFPMDLMDSIFGSLTQWTKSQIATPWLSSFIGDGLISGLGGVLIFIPQITLLFFLIGLLEEVGYMSRVVFIFDRLMRKFGMNGRSVVGLISAGACAIPAIMSTRTIENWRERIITILVLPLVSCSARIPVYALLVAFAIPNTTVGGIFKLQGVVFFVLYFLGVVFALLIGYIIKKFIKSSEESYLIMEMPNYQKPYMRNVFFQVYEKVKSFVISAGSIILKISIVLWLLAYFGPTADMNLAEETANKMAIEQNMSTSDKEVLTASLKLESSYLGHLGKFIEPGIRPLGYDWKIGIALLSSFAAREVFVGTMNTIYNIGGDPEDHKIIEKMEKETFMDTGEKVYTLATVLSLLVFYVFAMQCMGTLAVTKRETNSWRWPMIQLFYMTGLAYFLAWVTYNATNYLV